MLLLNAFSLNMFNPSNCFPIFREVSIDEVSAYPIESAIGHADTANVISGILERDIPTNRISVTLNPGDSAIVAQYIGPRLPEGATQLPSGATIKFYYLEMVDVNSLKLTSSQR
jgi:hypothetical protein